MKNDIVDTDKGINVSIWLQGCPFHCIGCHNPETWDFNGGIEIKENLLLDNIYKALIAYNIKRNLSILGGEPLCKQNLKFTKKLIKFIKKKLPDIKIYLWTGFDFESLSENKEYKFILDNVDILITGPYIQAKRDITLHLRGSSNQQVWRRASNNKLVLEKHISK